MSASSRTKLVALTLAVVALAVAVPVQSRIDSVRQEMVSTSRMPRQLPVAAATSAVLGGFRGIAVDILWVQADSMLNKKQFYQLAALYDIISILQPNFPAVWTFNAWNLAFNISAEWGRPKEKWDWIKQGIEFAERGLEFNPDSADLTFEIAILYMIKVNSNEYFIARLREEKGLNHYEQAYKYAIRAAELSMAAGGDAQNERRMAYHSLFGHGNYMAGLGNLAEAKIIYDEAERGAKMLTDEHPEDVPVRELILRIRAAKARYGLQ